MRATSNGFVIPADTIPAPPPANICVIGLYLSICQVITWIKERGKEKGTDREEGVDEAGERT